MTVEMQAHLKREMDDALAIEDSERRHDAMLTVLVHQNDALIDCQRKTSDRVKGIVAEKEAEKNKKLGAKWAFGLMISVVSVVGPIAAIKICKVVGIMW